MSAATSYEEEQARLARGEDAAGILPIPRMPEVNPEVYTDVTDLIFHGFLTRYSLIQGVPFLWKTLNQHEFDLVRFSSGPPSAEGASDRFWYAFIGHSLFMIDGINILPDRERWVPEIQKTVREFPKETRQQVLRHLSELNRRAALAVMLAEAYALETYSRFRWVQVRGLDLSQPCVTGIPGTERLGLNWAQLTWRALNQMEDMHAQQERDWENAKFIGACFAGKGVQKVYNQDHDRHRKETEDRIARKDSLLRHVLQGESLSDKTVRDGQQVIVARTVEDLAEQMARDLRGEKDWHDRVVEAETARVRAAFEARQQQLAEMARRNEEKFQGQGVHGGTNMEGLSPEQVQERILRFRQQQAQEVNRRVIPEHDEKMDDHMKKWGLAGPAASPMPREVGKPFRSP